MFLLATSAQISAPAPLSDWPLSFAVASPTCDPSSPADHDDFWRDTHRSPTRPAPFRRRQGRRRLRELAAESVGACTTNRTMPPAGHGRSGQSRFEMLTRMEVSLLYFDGRPNHSDTLALLNTLLQEASWDGTVQLVNVDLPGRSIQG